MRKQRELINKQTNNCFNQRQIIHSNPALDRLVEKRDGAFFVATLCLHVLTIPVCYRFVFLSVVRERDSPIAVVARLFSYCRGAYAYPITAGRRMPTRLQQWYVCLPDYSRGTYAYPITAGVRMPTRLQQGCVYFPNRPAVVRWTSRDVTFIDRQPTRSLLDGPLVT